MQEGDFLAPAELISPPLARPINSRAMLWALTLFSFLGGTYYGYQFRKAAVAADAHLVVLADGGVLVARWNAKALAAATGPAELRVNSGVRQTVLALDAAALRSGELKLTADPGRSADVELVGRGVSSRARFLAGDPLDAALVSADADSLRQQLADQQELNTTMERKLGQTR
jgi:hypothetical protein